MSLLGLFLILHTGSIHPCAKRAPAGRKEKVQRCLQMGMERSTTKMPNPHIPHYFEAKHHRFLHLWKALT